jgi:hypothetical protein
MGGAFEILAAWQGLASYHPVTEATDKGRVIYHG